MNDPPFPDSDDRTVLEPACARCPALAESRTRISWGNGPPEAEVVVIGEAPGAGDPDADRWAGGNHTGLAYTSRHSGRAIRRLFEAVGVEAYYTNAVKCFPADPEDPTTNREPTSEELANCRPYLETELREVDPRVAVATGKHATRSVLALDGEDVEGFLDAVLEPRRLEAVDATLLPLLHPSYQAVWLSRLGYDRDGYREAVAARLADCGVDVDPTGRA